MHEICWRRVVYRDLYWQTGYERVNLGIVKDVVRHRLTDLLAYCAAIRTASGRIQSL